MHFMLQSVQDEGESWPVMSRKDLEDGSKREKSNALEFRPLCPWQILSMEQTEDPASLTMDDMKLDETSDPDLFFFCLHDSEEGIPPAPSVLNPCKLLFCSVDYIVCLDWTGMAGPSSIVSSFSKSTGEMRYLSLKLAQCQNW